MRHSKEYPSQETIKSLLEYDQDTGVFKWKKRDFLWWNTRYAGRVAGVINCRGYMIIQLGKKNKISLNYMAHRLAWIYMNGSISMELEIDHINGVSTDNKISNLRLCNQSQNLSNRCENKNRKNKLPKGVEKQSGNTFCARITSNGKRIYLGNFPTSELAQSAYCKAALKYHGEFARAS